MSGHTHTHIHVQDPLERSFLNKVCPQPCSKSLSCQPKSNEDVAATRGAFQGPDTGLGDQEFNWERPHRAPSTPVNARLRFKFSMQKQVCAQVCGNPSRDPKGPGLGLGVRHVRRRGARLRIRGLRGLEALRHTWPTIQPFSEGFTETRNSWVWENNAWIESVHESTPIGHTPEAHISKA